MAYNRIKKTDVFEYFVSKLNSTSFNSKVMFDTNSYYNIVYKPQKDDNGQMATEYETDEETYRQIVTTKVPVSVGISTGDFKSVKSIDESIYIDTTDFSVVLSFYVFMDNADVHFLQMLAIEQFRDMLIADLDFIPVKSFNYANLASESIRYETIATNAEDIQLGNVTTINGKNFLICSIQIDISTAKDVIYGNQFQFYAKSSLEKTFKWNEQPLLEAPFDYEVETVEELPTPTVENKKALVTITNAEFGWEEQETPLEAPFDYDVDDFALLPQPPLSLGLKGRVAREVLSWEETTSHIGDNGYIKTSLLQLPSATLGKKAVLIGYDLINSNITEWNNGFQIQWVSKGSLTAPYDYDVNSYVELPSPTTINLKARIRTLAWQSNTFAFADYGYIKTNVSLLPTGNAHIGKKATVIDYTPTIATLSEYTASATKADITTDDSWNPNNVDDMLYNFQNEFEMYFTELPEFAYGGVVKFDNGFVVVYWKFVGITGASNYYYTYNVTDTDYYESETVTTKPRITVIVGEGYGSNDILYAIQTQHSGVFSDLETFYDDEGVVRVNDGLGFTYAKFTFVNGDPNTYYIYDETTVYDYYLSVDMPDFTYKYFISVFDEYVENPSIPYERILPLMVEWGSVQATVGGQLLYNPQMSEELKRKAQLIHNVVASRGWAITMTFVLQDDTIVEEFFRETYPIKDDMQKSYTIKLEYLKKYLDPLGVPYFDVYEQMGFEIQVIPTEPNVLGLNYGDVVSFVISFVPNWGE